MKHQIKKCNVSIDNEVHKKIKLLAVERNITIYELVNDILRKYK